MLWGSKAGEYPFWSWTGLMPCPGSGFAYLAVAVVVLMTGCTKTDDRRAEPTAAAGKPANSPKLRLTADKLSRGISFSSRDLPSYVKRFYGVAQAEPFGRWTTGKLAFVELDGTLPHSVRMWGTRHILSWVRRGASSR